MLPSATSRCQVLISRDSAGKEFRMFEMGKQLVGRVKLMVEGDAEAVRHGTDRMPPRHPLIQIIGDESWEQETRNA